MTGVLQGLEPQPASLEFGTVQEGCSYSRSLVLKNVGIDPCRFRIRQPPPSTGVRVIYTPGPVSEILSVSVCACVYEWINLSKNELVDKDVIVCWENMELLMVYVITILMHQLALGRVACACDSPFHYIMTKCI